MKQAGELIDALLNTSRTREGVEIAHLVDAWKKAIGGESAHSHVVDVQFNAVIVEVDHPARMQLLRMREQLLLDRLRKLSGVTGVRRIRFRLGSREEKHTPARRERIPGPEELRQLRDLVNRMQQDQDEEASGKD